MTQLFKNKDASLNVTNNIVIQLKDQLNANSFSADVSRNALVSLESLNSDVRSQLENAGSQLVASMESIAASLNLRGTDAQIEASAYAGILAGDFKAHLSKNYSVQAVSTESLGVTRGVTTGESMASRSISLESYSEQDNRNATMHSMAYNYQASRQDEFGEVLFPTITVAPDSVGFGITVNLMRVFDGAERKITGATDSFKFKNIIRAVADHTVLRKDQIRITPVYRAQNADKFGTVPSYTVSVDGVDIVTAPLAFKKKVDLLAISQTDASLASGIMNETDEIQPGVKLDAIYLGAAGNVLRLPTGSLPVSNFVYAVQGNGRLENLNFSTKSIMLNKNSKENDGSPLTGALAKIVTNDYIVNLEVSATGSVNLETGELIVHGNMVNVVSIKDAVTGVSLSLIAAGDAADIAAALNGGTFDGYDVHATLSNMNRRKQGQLINTTRYTQLYQVEYRSPITAYHPTTVGGETDTSDVEALVAATRIGVGNESVTALISITQALKDYIDSRDATGESPDVLGVGRFYVRPTFVEDTIDMVTAVDSTKSHERRLDIQAVLINRIRDMAARMYVRSEYKAANDALTGGVSAVPTVIVATDPVTAHYLTVNGDLRTLGPELNLRVVSSLDKRMAGRIYVTFGVFDDNRNTVPHPLNFGNMAWAPELVLTANISRNGQTSRETVVQPRYLFVNNLPVVGLITVANIPEVLSKVLIYTDEK